MTQFFKGDSVELKFYNSGLEIFQSASADKSLFFENAFTTALLGDLLWENGWAPLSNAMPKDAYRLAFYEIFESFKAPGSFEGYLTVFRKIFGEDVVVTFTVPGPGKLIIDIEASTVLLSDFITQGGDEVIDDEGDNIAFQSLPGFDTQYELEQMLFEMVPAGIYTEISLALLPVGTFFESEGGDILTTEDEEYLEVE